MLGCNKERCKKTFVQQIGNATVCCKLTLSYYVLYERVNRLPCN